MPNIMEANGEIFWTKEVVCYECGQDHETYDPNTPEGAYELCDDCVERERDEERERQAI